MQYFLKFILGMKFYVFRKVPLSIIRSFSLRAQQWCMSYRFADSSQQTCMTYTPVCVYSEKLLMMDTGTVRNM